MELNVIRRCQPFHTVIVLPLGQEGSRGQVIHLPSDPQASVNALLPLPPQATALLVRQQKPGPSRFTQYWVVRPTRVYNALHCLQKLHPRYQGLPLMQQEEFVHLANSWNNTAEDQQTGEVN